MSDPQEDPPGPSAQKSTFKPVDSDPFQIGPLTNAAKRAELLDRGEVTAAFENIFVAVRNIVEGSSLSDQERKDTLHNIPSWSSILDNVATQQAGPG